MKKMSVNYNFFRGKYYLQSCILLTLTFKFCDNLVRIELLLFAEFVNR